MAVQVVPYREEWPSQFAVIADGLRRGLASVRSATIEHAGSTSVPGLPAKPIIDIDVVVASEDVQEAVAALQGMGYGHRGDLGVAGREAFRAPDIEPRRNVYVCEAGTLSVRNHLAVREVLLRRDDLRDEYAVVKTALAADPDMDIGRYIAGKSDVLRRVLADSSLVSEEERQEIYLLNRTLG